MGNITTGRERLIRTRVNSKFHLIQSCCEYIGIDSYHFMFKNNG